MSNAFIDGLYEVAINGRPYRTVQELHRRKFLEVIRQQADTSREPSEASLNPEGMWRRAQDDWVFGSGQKFYDDDESVRKRYRVSRGVSPWEKGQLSLLNTTSPYLASVNIGKSVLADGYLWVIFGPRQLARWDGTTWAYTTEGDLTLEPQATIQDIASDGSNVYIAACNTAKDQGGLFLIEAGDLSFAKRNNVIIDRVGYVRGRLMMAAAYSLYNVTDPDPLVDATPFTAPAINTNWQWTAFGEGQSYIYVAGHGSDVSYIYRISLREDGTALTAPIVAAQLPDGEVVNVIQSYLGVVVLGTSKGMRIAVPSGGSLTYGPLIDDCGPVYSVEVQDRFVWVGNDQGELWRADLSRFIEGIDLTPAYARDIESGSSGRVLGVHTFGGRRVFVVEGDNVYYEQEATVASGTFHSGRITYGMTDLKNFVQLEVHCEPFAEDESVDVEFILDDQTAFTVGTLTGATSKAIFNLGNLSGTFGEVKLTLNQSTSGLSPVVQRFVLRALPKPARTEQIQVAIDLRESLSTLAGAANESDVWSEFSLLQGLVTAGDIVVYQEFENEYYAQVDNVQWGPDLDVDSGNETWEGVCLVTLKLYSQLNPDVISDPTGIYISELEANPPATGGGGSSVPTVVVAAYNARQEVKDAADFVCTGTNDDTLLTTIANDLFNSTIGDGGPEWYGSGARILLSEGTFRFGDSGVPVMAGIALEGSGESVTYLVQQDGASLFQMLYDDGYNLEESKNIILRNLTIDGRNQGTVTDGVLFWNGVCDGVIVENVTIMNMSDLGFYLSASYGTFERGYVKNLTIKNCVNNWGIYNDKPNMVFDNILIENCAGNALYSEYCNYTNFVIRDCSFSLETGDSYSKFDNFSIIDDVTPDSYNGALDAGTYGCSFSNFFIRNTTVFGVLCSDTHSTFSDFFIEETGRGGLETSGYYCTFENIRTRSTSWYGISNYADLNTFDNCMTVLSDTNWGGNATVGHEGGIAMHGGNCIVSNCYSLNSKRNGIYVWGAGHIIRDCIVRGPGGQTPGVYHGIFWASGGSGSIQGNYIRGHQYGTAFNNMDDGVNVDVSVSDVYVRSNHVSNANGVDYNLLGTNINTTADNFAV